MMGRLLIPLVVVAALLVGAAVALAVKNSMGQSAPPPTSIPAPATLPPTQPTATGAQPTATLSSATTPTSGTPVATTQATPGTSATAGPDPVSLDPKTIATQGYTAKGTYVWAALSDGRRLYAWPATCTGSADGYCQKVFFFIGTHYLGTDTAKASNAITKVDVTNSGDIAVTYPDYKSGDPLCCPSGKPVTITYHWDGTKLVPSGTPPGH